MGGCGDLQEGGPAQEAHESQTSLHGETQKVLRGDVVSVEHAAVVVLHTVRFNPPPQQRRTPGGDQVGPCEARSNEPHANPEHGLLSQLTGHLERGVVVGVGRHLGHVLNVPHRVAGIDDENGAGEQP